MSKICGARHAEGWSCTLPFGHPTEHFAPSPGRKVAAPHTSWPLTNRDLFRMWAMENGHDFDDPKLEAAYLAGWEEGYSDGRTA